jgi:hypothetical protein
MKEELIISSQVSKKFVVEWKFNPHLMLIILIEFTTQEWH